MTTIQSSQSAACHAHGLAARAPRFSGILANYSSDTFHQYNAAFRTAPQEHLLKPYATRIFRELPTTLAVSKLVSQTPDPVQINLLGASDGSEAYAYAIALAENKQPNQSVSIRAIDYTPGLVGLAKTGYLVCTDQEKRWANDHERAPGNPLAGSGWDRYLTRSQSAPPEFDGLVKQHPMLAQITRDPVSRIAVGSGMDWYQVNTDKLPPITFEEGDMREIAQQPPSEAKKQVYVLANSACYVAQDKGMPAFVKLLQDIQNNNLDRETYIVLGDVEHQLIRQAPALINILHVLGYQPVSEEELSNLNLQGSTIPGVKKAYGNIWKLNAIRPVKIKLY